MKWRFLLHPQSVSQNLHTDLTTEIVVHTGKNTGDFYNILRCQLSTFNCQLSSQSEET